MIPQVMNLSWDPNRDPTRASLGVTQMPMVVVTVATRVVAAAMTTGTQVVLHMTRLLINVNQYLLCRA